MRIICLGAESLGARSVACMVESGRRSILIDPGVALGPRRFGLPPHPREQEAACGIRSAICNAAACATDIVVSHYHGDHVPLAHPDPSQVAIADIPLRTGVHFWCKGPGGLSRQSRARRHDLVHCWGPATARPAEGRGDDSLCCSPPVPHGIPGGRGGAVMMTCITDGNERFVHASDIQLLNDEAIDLICQWRPTVVFASGPPLYRAGIHPEEREGAAARARRLLCVANTLILDHHLLRSAEWLAWLRYTADGTGGRIVSAAEFMGRSPLLLEASRARLYQEEPAGS
jgi:predicted metallo-beta-lactamase superfamily hydrolase